MVRRDLALLFAIISLGAAACGTSSPATSVGASPSTAATPSATASPGAIPSSPGSALRVTGLDLRSTPGTPLGTCPLAINFAATITVVGGPGTVSYKWISSDGDVSPVKTLTFSGPGTQDASSDWTVDPKKLPTHAGWSSIEIVDPVAAASDGLSSKRVDFGFTCDTDNDIESIGFGLGGSDADCSIATPMRTFAPTDRVRVVATYSPSLAAGTVVTFQLSRDGAPVDGYPVTITLQHSTKCVHGSVSPGILPASQYHLDVIPDNARAVGGDFDTR